MQSIDYLRPLIILLAEILKELRKSDYSGLLDQYVELDGSLSQRDKTAIRKTFSGLMKLIYPHKEITEVELLEISSGLHDKDYGKISWKFNLKPAETKELKLSYSVKYPKDKQINLY